jgi:hypothetical protein
MRTEQEIRRRVEEIRSNMDRMLEDKRKWGWSHVEALCFSLLSARLDALLWALGEERGIPKGRDAYYSSLEGRDEASKV